MRLPGFSFRQMHGLVYDNNWQLYQIFTDELLIAIFWEETQFNNIPQSGGTAVGLGQVEPSELWTLKKYGVQTNAAAILASPAHAVQITSYYLRHLYESQQTTWRSKSETLKRYAGYYWDKAAWRLMAITGWEACERALQQIPSDPWDYPDLVKSALSMARAFPKDDDRFHKALFPGT